MRSIAMTLKYQAGSTLMEVLIALLVFSIGLQGIASLQYQAVKENIDSTQRSQGAWSAQELINRIRANSSGRANGDYTVTDNNPCAVARPAPFCADLSGANAAACTATQMATFDIWESICTTPNLATARDAGILINPNLTIACTGGCSTTSEITLTLEWQSKAVTDDADNISDADDALKTQQFQQVFRP